MDQSSDTLIRGLHRSKFSYQPTVRDYVNLDMIDDDGESINSLKRQRLESLTELDEFETPEQDMNPLKIEDPTPMNPIDFYDN